MADTEAETKKEPKSAADKLREFTVFSSKLRIWYYDYILSDFTYAAFAAAVLATLKIAFNVKWEQFWQAYAVFFTLWAAVSLSKIAKRYVDGPRKH
jgi:hypothetical protein